MISIAREVQDFIERPDPSAFEGLALRVFRRQFESIPAYQRYCREYGVDPATVRAVDDVPPVSTVAFKHAELCISVPERVFVTSGTSVGPSERGRHPIPWLEIYRSSALRQLDRMLFADGAKISMLALHPTADLMPESSLAQMITWCIERFGNGNALCAANRSTVSVDAARGFLLDSAARSEPVCILGTTAALAALLSSLRESGSPIRLPSGSRIMDTGGAKGQVRPLALDELLVAAERWLGVGAPMVINEYGMTEMCSQLYDLTSFNRDGHPTHASDLAGRRPKLGPPWLRAAAIDPVTLERLPDGQPGLLRFFDLANVGSVSAIVTEDLGIVDGNAVYVLGRTAGPARGCALGIEEFAQSPS
jgi:hypothetical protein